MANGLIWTRHQCCNLWDFGNMRWKPKEHAFKKKDSSIMNSKKVMLHHLKKQGNLLMMLMSDLVLSKFLECICGIENQTFNKNVLRNENNMFKTRESIGCKWRWSFLVPQPCWCIPKLFDRLNCESKCENDGRIRSWGMFLGSQHFGGRGAWWNFEMGTRTSDK
jgi:hypothetical protein